MSVFSQSRLILEPCQSPLAVDCQSSLRGRGIAFAIATTKKDQDGESNGEGESQDTPTSPSEVITILLSEVPRAVKAAKLAERIALYSRSTTPPILLIPLGVGAKDNEEQAACIALFKARGAIVLRSPAVWLECVVLLTSHGLPPGPRAAIVARAGGWLEAEAAALQKRAEAVGERFSPLSKTSRRGGATDFVLTDSAPASSGSPSTLVIPVGSGERGDDGHAPNLLGLDASLAAAEFAGHASVRIAAGDGAAPVLNAGAETIDSERFTRQLAKLGEFAGDHECKVLLSSHSVVITRQAVATTPSAATRLAKKAGYPVQIKAWGPKQPSERQGALVQTGLETAAEVRRAFSTICARCDTDAVIVRETPILGREIRIHIRQVGAVGLVVFLYHRAEAEPVAALAPLRPIDADSMARHVVASRAGDRDPDWAALATLLVNASHMVASTPRITSVELSRVRVGHEGEGAVVVDARATLVQPS